MGVPHKVPLKVKAYKIESMKFVLPDDREVGSYETRVIRTRLLIILQFPNAVVPNAVGCRKKQMSAKERKGAQKSAKSPKGNKRAQKSAPA